MAGSWQVVRTVLLFIPLVCAVLSWYHCNEIVCVDYLESFAYGFIGEAEKLSAGHQLEAWEIQDAEAFAAHGPSPDEVPDAVEDKFGVKLATQDSDYYEDSDDEADSDEERGNEAEGHGAKGEEGEEDDTSAIVKGLFDRTTRVLGKKPEPVLVTKGSSDSSKRSSESPRRSSESSKSSSATAKKRSGTSKKSSEPLEEDSAGTPGSRGNSTKTSGRRSGGRGSGSMRVPGPKPPKGTLIDNLYPRCPPHPLANATGKVSLQEWLLKGFAAAPVMEYPFKRSIYWCDVLPPDVYQDLSKMWPPLSIQHKDRKSGGAKRIGYKNADERWKISLHELMSIPNGRGKRSWKDFDKGKSIWKKVANVLFSSQFEKLIWKKLQLNHKWKYRDFRIQSDKNGFAIGLHPDISKKIATMQFYLPTGSSSQKKKQENSYGTCMHTVDQFKSRNRSTGANKCEAKFRFLPNSAYTFSVHRNSYHSVEKVQNAGLRRTFMLNWYKTKWQN